MKSPLSYQKYIIENKTEVAPETVLFRLKGKLRFEPGQFVQIYLPHIGEATYAPCSDTSDRNGFDICIRGCGSTSDRLIEQQIGDTLLLRGAYGNGWPTGTLLEKNVLLISGGMGIVPLMPLIYELRKFPKQFGKITLLAGFKTPDHVLFNKDLKELKKTFDYVKIAVEKTSADWWGENCMITELIDKIIIPAGTIALICGPEIMYKPCIDILLRKKMNPKNIYASFERRMECGIGACQHCTIGKYKVCEDGPVFSWQKIKPELNK